MFSLLWGADFVKDSEKLCKDFCLFVKGDKYPDGRLIENQAIGQYLFQDDQTLIEKLDNESDVDYRPNKKILGKRGRVFSNSLSHISPESDTEADVTGERSSQRRRLNLNGNQNYQETRVSASSNIQASLFILTRLNVLF
ncbi:hypothetical protein AYI68_g6246 [Smittium mucronatum]|uniref:Uncharacterized protein n=1 Tax=Smittium mucronatum TaxID=133383 RepID=A0A1R0GS04_9FUNG|nr:hypothetical protein AYI68_g6246 [Smittium mucronatum]